MKDTQVINSIAGKIENLPTLPGIAIKLLQAVQKNEPNISEIGEILSKDVALTAKILKLVNSSFYSLSSRITTVDHAIKLLGLNTVKNLALGFSLITGFQKKGVKAIDYSRFWKDSLVGAMDDRDYANLLDKAKAEMAKLSVEMINELLEKNREIEFLREQTTIDSMTSIHNHKGFCESISRELSRAKRYKRPLSLIFADIDHFKLVNDTFGHLAGDCALKAVAICLKNGLREADYLARYGGEEFAIILPESNMESAFLVAERLREKIESQNIVYKDKTISLTLSFGVACMPSNQDLSSDSLIKMADDALYTAKTPGRNRCCMLDRGGNECS